MSNPWVCRYCGAQFPVPTLTRDHEQHEHEDGKHG